MEVSKYNPKDELALDVARDLLRHLGKYGSEENCKKLCFLTEVVFDD